MKPTHPSASGPLLIRHGESEGNAGLPTSTAAGIRLTARGHQQARDFAAGILEPPERIVVSPYLRTSQTAEPLIARFPAVPVEVWDVHEYTYLDPSKYVGTTEAQRGVFAREYWRRCDPLWHDGGGAESFVDLMARIDATLARLRALADRRILVFTHGYFIKAFLLRLEKPGAPVDAVLMAAFRDGRKNVPLPSLGQVSPLICQG